MEDDNYIIAEIYIDDDNIDKDIKIINSFGNYRREIGNLIDQHVSKLVEEFGTKTENDNNKDKKKKNIKNCKMKRKLMKNVKLK